MQTVLKMQPDRIQPGVHLAGCQECLRIGGKPEVTGSINIIEWFDTKPVTCGKQALLRSVPQGKRKHPFQITRTVCTPFAVGLQDDFCIAVTDKRMTLTLQLSPQCTIVIDRAVEYQAKRAICHRLVRLCTQVNNRQAPMSQCNLALTPGTLIVRPAACQMRQHRVYRCDRCHLSVATQFTTDSTHDVWFPPGNSPYSVRPEGLAKRSFSSCTKRSVCSNTVLTWR